MIAMASTFSPNEL